MILPLYAGLDRAPAAMLEAARDLGASRLETFRRVTWPLTRTAVVVSLLVTSLPMLGDYFTVDLLSGSPSTLDDRQPDQQLGADARPDRTGGRLRADHPDRLGDPDVPLRPAARGPATDIAS